MTEVNLNSVRRYCNESHILRHLKKLCYYYRIGTVVIIMRVIHTTSWRATAWWMYGWMQLSLLCHKHTGALCHMVAGVTNIINISTLEHHSPDFVWWPRSRCNPSLRPTVASFLTTLCNIFTIITSNLQHSYIWNLTSSTKVVHTTKASVKCTQVVLQIRLP